MAGRGIAMSSLAAELIKRLDDSFLQATMPHPMPPLRDETTDTQEALLFELNNKMDRANWLLEGPDTYDVLDITVRAPPIKETRLDYAPFLVWGVSILNTQSAGGDTIYLRFTDSTGRYKQIPIAANSSLDLDLKGGLGTSVLRIASKSVDVGVTGVVLLKWPLKDSYVST